MTGPAPLAQQSLLDWDWVTRNAGRITDALVQHVELTLLAVAIGFLIAAPLALAAVRWRRLYTPLLTFTGVLFSIPSLALFVLLLAFAGTGLGRTTSLIGLVIYTLLILFRNNVAGLDSVSADVKEAAEAMGYTRARRLLRVEAPLALPVIMAGIRIATVTTIGLVTITALIGQGGLGQLFLLGFRRTNNTPLVVGIVLSVLLAVAADLALVVLQRRLTPWSKEQA
ncbi:MAG TPA: ABC transporter permease subunit [Egibacteraceae bacterium]|nr:ABC transporter permease subunit [Egibacteraceae bacterium]